MQLKIKKLKENARIPKRATEGAAGMDLFACITDAVALAPGQLTVIPTGVAQMVIAPVLIPSVVEVGELGETERGSGGFGSTGR